MKRHFLVGGTILWLLGVAPELVAQPADVEVSQKVTDSISQEEISGPVHVGERLSYQFFFKNNGPGYATNVSFRIDFGDRNLIVAQRQFFVSGNSILHDFQLPLAPGQTATVFASTIVAQEGSTTNVVSVTAANDPEPGNNTLSTTLTALPVPLEGLRLAAQPQFAVDRYSGKVFFAPSEALEYWSFKPSSGRFQKEPIGAYYFDVVTAAPSGGAVYFLKPPDVVRYSTISNHLSWIPGSWMSFSTGTMAVSPLDPDLLVVSGPNTGTLIYKDSKPLPDHYTIGVAQFSADGHFFYLLERSGGDCAIHQFEVQGTSFRYLNERPVCFTPFPVFSDGLLYFSDGRIYDLINGVFRASIPDVLSGSVVLRDDNGNLIVLSKIDDTWLMRRFRAATLEEFARSTFASVVDYIDHAEILNNETLVFSTGQSIEFQPLPPDPANERIVVRKLGSAAIQLQFFSHAQKTYRVERRQEDGWESVTELGGNDSVLQVSLPATNHMDLFRVLEFP